jgi:hypothetical protein
MSDRVFFSGVGVIAAVLVVLAMVWPQGLGERSPPPFGHFPTQRTPEARAAMQSASEAAARRANNARQTVRDLQTEAVTAP